MQLEKLIHSLLKTEQFFAHFILNSQVRYETRPPTEENVKKPGYVGTAGAGVQNGSPVLLFNTHFMDSLPFDSQKAVLKHEILHLLLDHNDKSYYDVLNLQAWNLAMDCAINQYIDSLPDMAITLPAFEKLVGKKLQPYESAVYYYNELVNSPNIQKVKIPDSMDDHGALSESELDKQIKKGTVQKAADAAVKAAAGNVPEGLQKVLDGLRDKPLVNWKQQLRNFVASAISSKTKHTRKKTHRRFEIDQPGKRKKRELKLAVCVDSSGSVSDAQFAAFINEIVSVSKNCAEANLIYADCEVQKVVNLKGGKAPPNERYGNGGTAYEPAIRKAVELGSNAIIYFGDMDTADTPKNPGLPVLWVTCGSEVRPGDFGRMLKIDVPR